MPTHLPHNPLLAAWQTSHCVTAHFFETLPEDVWDLRIPGAPQRTVRMIAGHIHNARCMWLKMIGGPLGITAPPRVDRRKVTRSALLTALKKSNRGISDLLLSGMQQDGRLEMEMPFANIPPDVHHFMAYLVAHEAHHRGQIVLVARALGHRLPPAVTNGLWQWKQRHRENLARSAGKRR